MGDYQMGDANRDLDGESGMGMDDEGMGMEGGGIRDESGMGMDEGMGMEERGMNDESGMGMDEPGTADAAGMGTDEAGMGDTSHMGMEEPEAPEESGMHTGEPAMDGSGGGGSDDRERSYYRRGRRFVVEEIADVRAVHVAEGRELGAPELGAPAAEIVRSRVALDLNEEVLAAFERANWRFVQPTDELSRAMHAGQDLRGADAVGKVIRKANGTVAIATNRLNVQLKPELTEVECEAVLLDKNLQVLSKLKFAPNLYEVIALGRQDSLEASVELHYDDRFILAEPTFIEHIPPRFTPSDPRYTDQWQWNNTGQSGGTAGADVSAEDAWDITRGAGVRVAVIDNGFDADHEDFNAAVTATSGFFTASGSTATFNQTITGMPGSNHGTFCAGMVGARHNNSRGGCGGAPECQLTLVACLGDQVGDQTTLARAVAYAADPSMEVAGASSADGADVLVCSLGPNGAVWDLTATLELALEGAAANGRSGRGLAIFWAASNGNNVDVTLDEVVSHPDVIAVVRSDRDDQEDNAARGDTVELIAPGVSVVSTRSGNTYGSSTGTSFAAPCAASCAALALSVNMNMSRDQLRQVMRGSADKIGGNIYDGNGHNDDYGFGRVNAHRAVLQAQAQLSAGGDSGPVVSWGSNRLDVFVVGTNSALYHKWWNGSAWGPSVTGYQHMGGRIISQPRAVAWGPNRLDAFVVGTNSALYHKWWNGSAWGPSVTGYEHMGGRIQGDPEVVSWGPNRLDVFVMGMNSALYHKWWNGSAWGPSVTGYEYMGGTLRTAPTVVSWGPNRLDVFVVGTNSALYHKWWNGSSWGPSVTGWEYMGGRIHGHPRVVSWGPNRLDVFVVGMDSGLYHKWWNGSSWGPSVTGWEDMEGKIIAF